MGRFALYLGGVSVAFAAMIVFNTKRRALRRVPVTEAAEMLKTAWEANHTRA